MILLSKLIANINYKIFLKWYLDVIVLFMAIVSFSIIFGVIRIQSGLAVL